jgi:phosphinothricin acetyltransferase
MLLRIATAADAPGVRAVYAPIVELTSISFEYAVPTVEAMAARITERYPAHPWLVACHQEAVAGYAYAGRFAARAAYAWSVETSVYVAEGERRRGVGRALYTALLRILSSQGFGQAFATIALPNPGSVALHERMGFTLSGVYRGAGRKLGAWHDVGRWQRSLGPTAAEPRAPLLLTELGAGVLDAALAAGAALLD